MLDVNIGKGFLGYFGFFSEFLFLIFHINKFDIFYIWFADYHSYLATAVAKIFKIKCYLCLGGYDAHIIVPGKPANLKDKFRKFCVIYSIKNASLLFPVSNWLSGFIKEIVDKDKIVVANCCIDVEKFKSHDKSKKENIILTIGGGGYLSETKRKKLDFFVEGGNYFSNQFPEYNAKFILIGHQPNNETYIYLKDLIKNPNIEILPVIDNPDELQIYLEKSKIYCQFSESEAFGIAVIEAMFNQSIPFVYNAGAPPEVVNGAGLILNDYDIILASNIIKEILDNKHEELRLKAKQRVLDNYTLNKRKEILFKYL